MIYLVRLVSYCENGNASYLYLVHHKTGDIIGGLVKMGWCLVNDNNCDAAGDW